MITKHYELPLVFIFGGSVNMLLEITWRGFTHWSMGICGGICFLGIYIFEILQSDCHISQKCLFGSFFITINEFITGCIVNLLLNWNVWDYSEYIFNIKGQVCMLYSILWFLLCIPAFKIARLIRDKIFSPKKALQ